MGSKKKQSCRSSPAGKKRLWADHYTETAREKGYPARSVFKLEEIDRRFQELNRILRRDAAILDIGAAPGSWSRFVLSRLGSRGHLVAVDLHPLTISANKRLSFMKGDIFDDKIDENLCSLLAELPYDAFDAVISDAAPATTGNRSVDTTRSEALVTRVADLADRFLGPEGVLVVKLFQGGGEREILKRLRMNYTEVKTLRPKAVRNRSFEVYLTGVKRG